jgi:hypothetical protein
VVKTWSKRGQNVVKTWSKRGQNLGLLLEPGDDPGLPAGGGFDQSQIDQFGGRFDQSKFDQFGRWL